MSRQDYESLRDDIDSNGLIDPIWLHEDRIIDGRHRYKACIESEFSEYEYNDLVGFVVSMNLRRRHLNTSQRKRRFQNRRGGFIINGLSRQEIIEFAAKFDGVDLPVHF